MQEVLYCLRRTTDKGCIGFLWLQGGQQLGAELCELGAGGGWIVDSFERGVPGELNCAMGARGRWKQRWIWCKLPCIACACWRQLTQLVWALLDTAPWCGESILPYFILWQQWAAPAAACFKIAAGQSLSYWTSVCLFHPEGDKSRWSCLPSALQGFIV